KMFLVTPLTTSEGTDLLPETIAPLFSHRPPNVWISRSWETIAHPDVELDFRVLVHYHPDFGNEQLFRTKMRDWLKHRQDQDIILVTCGGPSTHPIIKRFGDDGGMPIVEWPENDAVFGRYAKAL